MGVGLLPLGVAAAWIPLRATLPNTDVALLLVLAVGAVSLAGGRWASVIGSFGGAAAFDVFDTPPYGQLIQSRARDVVTTVVLVGGQHGQRRRLAQPLILQLIADQGRPQQPTLQPVRAGLRQGRPCTR